MHQQLFILLKWLLSVNGHFQGKLKIYYVQNHQINFFLEKNAYDLLWM